MFCAINFLQLREAHASYGEFFFSFSGFVLQKVDGGGLKRTGTFNLSFSDSVALGLGYKITKENRTTIIVLIQTYLENSQTKQADSLSI